MGGNFLGARKPTGITVHALSDQIFAAFGTELVTLDRTGANIGGDKIVACKIEVGSFRFKVGAGDSDDEMAPVATPGDHVDGIQSVQFAVADGIFYLYRNNVMSVQGEGASDIMTYWFV
jgi:hypothetical protein